MKETKKHSVAYNFTMNFILNASQFLFPLITFPYVSRVLLASGNGKISFVSSVASYFIMVASLGIPTYGVRACARVRDDKKKLSKTVQEIFMINFIMTVLVAVTYFLCIFTIGRFQSDRTLFFIYGLNIILNMFGMNWLFQALEQYDYITVRSLAFKIISIVLMFAFVHHPEDYVIYGGITVFAAVGSNILNFVRMHQFIDFKWMGNYHLRQHVKPIFILFAQNLAVSIYTNLDTVMLGFMKTDTDVGYYNAAVKIKTILLSLVTSLGNVLLPRMSYYAKKNLRKEFRNTMLKALNFTVLMSVPLAVYFCIYAKEAIDFLAGAGYAGAVLAMQIITIAVIPNGLTGVLGVQVLTALEKEKYVLYSVIAGASIDLVLNYMFIPEYGAAGAAMATTIAEFIVLFVQIVFTRDILMQMKHKFRLHIYVLLSVLCGLISYTCKMLEIQSTLMALIISSSIFFGVYALGLVCVKEEIVLQMIGVVRNRIKGLHNDR